MFSRLVDELITDAVVHKIENYYGVAIQSNILKLKDMENASGSLENIFSHDHGGPIMKHLMNKISTVQSHQTSGVSTR